jgi:hypothetical protein
LNRRFPLGVRTCMNASAATYPPKSQHCIPRSQLQNPDNVLPWPGTDRFKELAAAAQILQASRGNTGTTTSSYGGDSSNNNFGQGGNNFGSGTETTNFGGQQNNMQQQGHQQVSNPGQGMTGLNGHAHAEPAPVAKKQPMFTQYVTDYGVPYYHNPDTNETVWELPVHFHSPIIQFFNKFSQSF